MEPCTKWRLNSRISVAINDTLMALDFAQIIKKVYDSASNRLRVDSAVTISSVTMEVNIDEADDSIVVFGNDGATNRALKTDSSGELQIDVLSLPSTDFATQLDDYSTANVTYVGIAIIGSATASAVWRIKKIDETTGMVITWADSNNNFDNVWDNRTGLTYG